MTKFDNICDFVHYLCHHENELYIAGAGYWGSLVGDYLNKHNISWNGFLDKNKSKNFLCGKQIFLYEDFSADISPKAEIIVSAPVPSAVNEATFVLSVFNQIVTSVNNLAIKDKSILVINGYAILRDMLNDIHGTQKMIERIRDFKNKYENRRCFVIGTGPSLTIGDLEKLEHEICFASNSIYALYPKTNWRPKYYCTIDGIMAKMLNNNSQKLAYIIDNCDAMFTGVERYRYYKDVLENVKKLYFFNTVYEDNEKSHIGFSDDAEIQLYGGGSVTYRLLQLAVYMGFTKIYLLGVDFSYSTEISANGSVKKNAVNNHNEVIELEEQAIGYSDIDRFGHDYAAFVDYQLWGYQAAKKYADAHNIKILNATRGGKLEVFPRVNFDSLFC